MKRNKESGQALVFTAVAMFVLIGFAGLAIDMGALRYQKRLQQTAADAAAIAGASNLAASESSSGVQAGAVAAATSNSFTSGTTGSQLCPTSMPACTACPAGTIGTAVGSVAVIVNNPPCSGPHEGAADASNYVEVFVTVVQPTYFMKAVGVPSETITARAVATNVSGGGPNSGCLWTLGPPSSSIEGVNVNGSVVVNATTCGIEDNGNFNTKGNALTINAGTFGIAGDANQTGKGGTVTCTNTPTSCPTPNMPAASDPMLNRGTPLTPPCSPCTGGTALSANAGGTYNPGTYTGISLAGNGTVTFNPGVYIIDSSAGFSCSGTPAITGTGVMFYFTNGGTWNCQGNDQISLIAPSPTNCAACAAQYDGILMYQDPADTAGPSLGGNTGSFYNGMLYFPKAQLTFFGNSTGTDVAMVVAEALAFSGNPTVNLQGAVGLPAGVTILTNTVLVE